MIWRIDQIHIENFKFFEDFEINLDGKNLLLYGENGSGKSSLYWAIYTIFQSTFKTPNRDGAQKYFLSDSPDNLRNIYCDKNKKSGIKIRFKREDGHTCEYEVSSERCDAANPHDSFMKITTISSDFMNYKYLSSLFDFKHSKVPEIFSLFEKDIFPTLFFSISSQMKDIHGFEPTESKSAEYWWRYLHDAINELPRGTNKKYILRTTTEFRNYECLLKKFNEQVIYFLAQISEKANSIIKNDFGIDDKIKIQYENARIIPITLGPEIDSNLALFNPQIIISVDTHLCNIKRPQSFFNEAKLTCMALSLRMAIQENKYKVAGDGVSALFLDDILVSLDMSMRIPVVDIILKFINRNNFQTFLMTHDRAFYNIIRNRLNLENEISTSWKYIELYHQYEKIIDRKIPTCLIIEHQTSLQRAEKYFLLGDYFASANALRRACEKKMDELLPMNCKLIDGLGGDELNTTAIRKKTLCQMLSEWERFIADKKELCSIVKEIQNYRDRIFNPMSHYDDNTPIFKSELIQAIKDVKEIYKILVFNIIDNSDLEKKEKYQIKIEGDHRLYLTFYFRHKYLKYSYNGLEFFNNPEVFVEETDVRDFNKSNHIFKLDNILNRMNRIAFNDDRTRFKNRNDLIRKVSDNSLLH